MPFAFFFCLFVHLPPFTREHTHANTGRFYQFFLLWLAPLLYLDIIHTYLYVNKFIFIYFFTCSPLIYPLPRLLLTTVLLCEEIVVVFLSIPSHNLPPPLSWCRPLNITSIFLSFTRPLTVLLFRKLHSVGEISLWCYKFFFKKGKREKCKTKWNKIK